MPGSNFPPMACRLCARRGKTSAVRLMTNREIAYVSDIGVRTVARLSLKPNWNGTRPEIQRRFSLACGVDLLKNKRLHFRFIRRHMKVIYRNSTSEQKALIRRILGQLGIETTLG